MSARRHALLLAVAALAATRALGAQGHAAHAPPAAPADTAGARAFVERARAATARFRDRRAAITAGYRRVGMDFPAMGEHWVHPGVVLRGRFDPAQPAMLAYVRVDGEPRLVGLAYAVPLGPGEAPPAVPGAAGAWHEHNGSIAEESVADAHAAHDGAAAGERTRLAILHVWTEAANPAGAFVTDNWTLPWVRLALAPPEAVDPDVARALSLVGGTPYWLARLGGGLDSLGAAAAQRVLDDAAREAAALVAPARARGALSPGDAGRLRALWGRTRERLAARVGGSAAARLER